MSITKQDWQEEQQRVDMVIAAISRQLVQLEREAGEVHSEATEIKKNFWDEVSINFSTSEDITETYFSMKQQADLLSERERSQRHAAAAMEKYGRLAKSPYFGRIDFRDERTGATEQIYLGIGSFLDERSDSFLIYDWRAPISSLYYDHGPGPAAYDTPGGEVQGDLLLKRQFVIKDGRIELLFDTGLTIGDELLQQALSRTSDQQMRSIVSTIQKEQNRIIRDEKARMLVVQGAAGSGKTSAALQRVAYLLYRHRETLRAEQMVLFSPNPLFNSYVSTVLPELGEQNMVQTTFQEYLDRRLSDTFAVEDPFTQIEYILQDADTPGYDARLAGIRYKSSAAYLKTLHRYIKQLEEGGLPFKPVKCQGQTVVSAAELQTRFYRMDPAIRLANRVVLLEEWIQERIHSFELEQWKEPWVEEQIELLSPEQYQRAYQKLRKQNRDKIDTFDDQDKEKELLAKLIVRERLKPVRRRVASLSFVDYVRLYLQIFEQTGYYEAAAEPGEAPEAWGDICKHTAAAIRSQSLPYEDATPFLYVKELVQGFETNTNVRHVIVDEAQDYSAFQLEFLKRLFPRARMTALGDLNQAIYAHTPVMGETEPLIALYGEEHTGIIRLLRSYRSTREIVAFTSGMVPGGESIIPFNRSGDKPSVTVVSDAEEHRVALADILAELQRERYASVAVIGRTAAECETLHEMLSEVRDVHLIRKETSSFKTGIQIIPAYLAKGVEFDAVIISDASDLKYGRELERKLFYTACTRAMHELRLLSVGEPSRFVSALEPGLYVRRQYQASTSGEVGR
ncbi:RNA polymerase recycling motor HelD [Paenibacillus sp. 1P07SE]|uniref:RNA polymerase recycling motor HelD n=1 Tax=Paenibacillus sp. 1P07SE TaxID=3132209 RepID=UPI0039A6FF01